MPMTPTDLARWETQAIDRVLDRLLFEYEQASNRGDTDLSRAFETEARAASLLRGKLHRKELRRTR